MSENRDNAAPGDPVAEEESTHTEVLAAARRATGAEQTDSPVSSNGEDPAPAQNQADQTDQAGQATPEPQTQTTEPSDDVTEELRRREAAASVDTQRDMPPVTNDRVEIAEMSEMPSAAADPAPQRSAARDGEVPVDSVEQLAAMYSQTPMPPDLRGNRGVGILIALLATIAFVLVYAGGIALLISRDFPPSTFLSDGLLPQVMTLGFGSAVATFFVAQMIVVLILGKANWWAYVLGGFFVAAAVWASASLGTALHDRFIIGNNVNWSLGALVVEYAFAYAALIAAVVAREISLWFGVWIGVRGRKVKQRNAEALAEYEEALAASKAK